MRREYDYNEKDDRVNKTLAHTRHMWSLGSQNLAGKKKNSHVNETQNPGQPETTTGKNKPGILSQLSKSSSDLITNPLNPETNSVDGNKPITSVENEKQPGVNLPNEKNTTGTESNVDLIAENSEVTTLSSTPDTDIKPNEETATTDLAVNETKVSHEPASAKSGEESDGTNKSDSITDSTDKATDTNITEANQNGSGTVTSKSTVISNIKNPSASQAGLSEEENKESDLQTTEDNLQANLSGADDADGNKGSPELKEEAPEEDLEKEEADMIAEEEPEVVYFDTESELKKLNLEIQLAKATLNKNEKRRNAQIDQQLANEKKQIDTALSREVTTTSKAYDQSIGQVQVNVNKAKARIESERKASIDRIRELTLTKTDKLDEVTDQKIQQMFDLGESFAQKILGYSTTKKTEANKNIGAQKKQLRDKANSLANSKAYASDQEKVKLIRSELLDMAEGSEEKIDEANASLLEQLSEDGETFANEFRDDAGEAADKLPEGKEDVVKKFDTTRDEMIKQIQSMGKKEIAQLDQNAADTITNLKKEKTAALAALKKQAVDAKASLDEMAGTTKKQLAEAGDKNKVTLDKALNDANISVPDLPDQLARDMVENVRSTKEQALRNDDSNGDLPVQKLNASMQKARSQTISGLGQTALSSVKSAADATNRYQKASSQIANTVIDSFKKVEASAETEMDKVFNGYVGQLDKSIQESKTNWEKKLTNDKATMDEKVNGVKAENQKVVNETLKEMPGRAKYLWESTAWSRFWDNVGGFLSGLWEGLMELVAGLLMILLYVLIAIAVLVLLAALIAGIAFLLGGLAALAGVLSAIASVVGAIATFIAFIAPALLWIGIAVGVGFFAYAIYEGVTTKGLSGPERWKIFGKGFFDLATSFELGWLKNAKLFKSSKLMKLWTKLSTSFGKAEKAKVFVRFFRGSVEKANAMMAKFGGEVKKLEQMYAKFSNGVQMEKLLAKVGDDPARLERLMAKCGDDPAKLQKVLRRMSPDEFEDAMKHYDDATKMLEDLKKSGGKSDEFLKGLNKTDNADDLTKLKNADENPHLNEDPNTTKKDEPKKDSPEEENPNSKKDTDEAEKAAAAAEAKGMMLAIEKADGGLLSLEAALTSVDIQYDVVKRFEYVPLGPGKTRVYMIASKKDLGVFKHHSNGNGVENKKEGTDSNNSEPSNENLNEKEVNLEEKGSSTKKSVDEILEEKTRIDDLKEAPDGYEFFFLDGKKRIRRKPGRDDLKKLTVNDSGEIVEFTGYERISKPGKLREVLNTPDGHQAHHIVPDNVVQRSPIHQEAIERGLFDIDRKSNGVNLAESTNDFSKDLTGSSKNLPTHNGSHKNYDREIEDIINQHLEKLETKYGDLKNIKDNSVFIDVCLGIERESMEILKKYKGIRLN